MALNELIAQGAQFKAPDLLGQYNNALAVQNGMQTNQMNQFKMDEARRAIDEQNKLRSVYAGITDYNDPSILNKIGAVSPKAAMDMGEFQRKNSETGAKVRKENTDAISVALKNSKDGLTRVRTPQEYLEWTAGNFADPVLGPWLKSRGGSLEQVLATVQDRLKVPGGFDAMLTASAVGADKMLENHFVNQDTGGTVSTLSMPKYGTGPATVVPGSVATKVVSPDTMANIVSHEKIAQNRLSQETASSNYTPDTIDFLAQTYIATGQLPPMGMGKAAAQARAMVLDRAQQLATGKTSPDATPTATSSEAVGKIATNKQDIAGQTATVKDFSSGLSSRRVTALNTALNHLGTMETLSNDLANKDTRVFNAAANTLAKQLGVAAPTSFDAARSLVANEVIKAVIANGGSMAERKEAAETFARASSPQQLQGVMNTYKELLAGQLSSLGQQYETGSGRKDFNKKLAPVAVKLLQPNTPVAAPVTGSGWGKAEVVK